VTIPTGIFGADLHKKARAVIREDQDETEHLLDAHLSREGEIGSTVDIGV